MQDPAEPEQGLVNENEASEVSRVHERHLEDGHDVFRHGLVGFEEKCHHQRVRRSDFHAIVHAVSVQARASASRSSLQTRVIDTHGDQVDSDGVVTLHHLGQL